MSHALQAHAAPFAASPRQRVVDAAVACFARSGFHGASMQEICAEAGMSPGALYRYFPSKVAIIAAIVEAERARHAAFFERLARAPDPVEALAGIGIDTLETILAGPGVALTAETMAEALRNPEIRALCDRSIAEARAAVACALRRGQDAGLVDPALDLDTTCRIVLALADGLCIHQALDPAHTAARFRPTLQVLLRRFLRPPSSPAPCGAPDPARPGAPVDAGGSVPETADARAPETAP